MSELASAEPKSGILNLNDLKRFQQLRNDLNQRVAQVYDQLCYLDPHTYARGKSGDQQDLGLVSSSNIESWSVQDEKVVVLILDPGYPYDGPSEHGFPVQNLFDYQKFPTDACYSPEFIDATIKTSVSQLPGAYQLAVEQLQQILQGDDGTGGALTRGLDAFESSYRKVIALRLLYGLATVHGQAADAARYAELPAEPYVGIKDWSLDLFWAGQAVKGFYQANGPHQKVHQALSLAQGNAQALWCGPAVRQVGETKE